MNNLKIESSKKSDNNNNKFELKETYFVVEKPGKRVN